MRLLQTDVLIARGALATNGEWDRIHAELCDGIARVVHPRGSQTFAINPRRKGNGVTTIKAACMAALRDTYEWRVEQRIQVGEGIGAGPIDATRPTTRGLPFALEWETGNISSSHRSLNKLALGIIQGSLAGGALILPSAEMYKYLTDRVGNVREIAPYYPLWRHVVGGEGVLAVLVIEHDTLDESVDLLAKGTDGWNRYQAE